MISASSICGRIGKGFKGGAADRRFLEQVRASTDASLIGAGSLRNHQVLMACPGGRLPRGRLFQGFWLDWYEELMPLFGGKNLVCVACKLVMHAKAVIYAVQNYVPLIVAGYAKRQSFYPEQTRVFMDKIASFSEGFGVTTSFPIYEEFDSEEMVRHLLEDFGLPSTGGGERKCLFCQTKTTATEREIGQYLDYMLPKVAAYVEHILEGRHRQAASIFPPGDNQNHVSRAKKPSR